jgi:hypothetical protein
VKEHGFDAILALLLLLQVLWVLEREPPEHEAPLDERKGGPLVYAVNQPGIFILVTSPEPAYVRNGVQINHAVVFVKLGNTNGPTGTTRGLWMDPHRTDRKTLELAVALSVIGVPAWGDFRLSD